MKLRIRKEQVENCATISWYEQFSTKPRCTIRTEFISLPEDFIEYLNSDGIILPEFPAKNESKENKLALSPYDPRFKKEKTAYDDDEDSWVSDHPEHDKDSDSVSSTNDSINSNISGNKTEKKCWEFCELELDIISSIERLGGEVFPKFTWSSPQDAAWVSGSLKCRSSGEIFLLLKSSDFIQFDLNHVYNNVSFPSFSESETSIKSGLTPTLVLRKWSNLNPAMEFRCIVYNKELLAICQRDARNFYEFLATEGTQNNVKNAIITLFENRIKDTFSENHYTMDVYVDRSGRAWLLDFGVLAEILTGDNMVTVDDASLEEKSKSLLSVPPHDLLSWDRLANLAGIDTTHIDGHKQNENDESEKNINLNAEANAEGNPDDQADILFLYVKSQQEALASGSVLGAHRVPIELVTGELNSKETESLSKKLDEVKARHIK